MLDILIKNGQIIDGTSTSPYIADIAIYGDEIVKIGKIDEEADRVIDASGKIVTPGFIDIHCHSDAIVFHKTKNPLRLQQGFTTEVIGNCGISAAPVNPKNLDMLSRYCNPFFSNVSVPYNWQSYGEFLNELEKHHPMLNTAGLVDRGVIAEKKKADVLVLDMERIHDNADYGNYNALSDGIEYVMINGQIAMDKGKFNNICAGKVLRH